MPWKSLSRHLLQSRLCRTSAEPSSPPQCTGHTQPHLLCIAYPIDCAIRDSWIQRDLFLYHTPAYGGGFFLFEERTFFSRLYSSHFISLSSFPYHFSSLSHTYLSLNITLLTCSYFAQKVTVISSFESPPPFFFFFSVLIVHLWIIQIADSEFETCSWLPGGNWRWTLQTTSLSQIWMNAALR